jgi:hypothetical protein
VRSAGTTSVHVYSATAAISNRFPFDHLRDPVRRCLSIPADDRPTRSASIPADRGRRSRGAARRRFSRTVRVDRPRAGRGDARYGVLSSCVPAAEPAHAIHPHLSPSSRGLGRGPFKAKTRVRIPLGTPDFARLRRASSRQASEPLSSEVCPAEALHSRGARKKSSPFCVRVDSSASCRYESSQGGHQ